MYDSGEIQDIRLVTEQIRHTRDDERDFSRAKWWDSATMDTLPSLVSTLLSLLTPRHILSPPW